MTRQKRIPVVQKELIAGAFEAAEAGRLAEAAGRLDAFCWRNATLQAEDGESWSGIKVAARGLEALSGTSENVQRREVRRILGIMRRNAMPKLRSA